MITDHREMHEFRRDRLPRLIEKLDTNRRLKSHDFVKQQTLTKRTLILMRVVSTVCRNIRSVLLRKKGMMFVVDLRMDIE
jgi:hypothetical protein